MTEQFDELQQQHSKQRNDITAFLNQCREMLKIDGQIELSETSHIISRIKDIAKSDEYLKSLFEKLRELEGALIQLTKAAVVHSSNE
jgi:hypothetical protein